MTADEVLADLIDFTEKAALVLKAKAREKRATRPHWESKRAGVLLVLEYINELRKGMQ